MDAPNGGRSNTGRFPQTGRRPRFPFNTACEENYHDNHPSQTHQRSLDNH